MHCELVVPALFAARTDAPLPALELLLARGRPARAEALGLERWLARSFGLGDALPAGALTVLADGGDPGEAFWLRADPVHLRLQRDWLALIPSAGFAIERAEAEALAAALNRHFKDQFTLHPLRADRWCLSAQSAVAFESRSPIELAGKDVNAHLPPKPWYALLNEIQMVLHEHPVNDGREPAINSVWLWGGGRIPQAAGGPWQSVTADEPVALGLARVAKIRHRELPQSAAQWLERMPEDGRHLILLDSLRAAHALGDADAYLERIDALERHWFSALLEALRSARVGMVTVHAPDSGVSFETMRGDLRRFWRRARPLSAYAA